MSDMLPVQPNDTDQTSDLGSIVTGLQRMMEIQGSVQKHQIDATAEAERDRIALERDRTNLQAAHASRASQQAFVLQICAVIIVAGVVGGGFYTNNMTVVTHALTAVLGMIAGVGLARRK